jgi:hypothetical protein
MIPDARFREKRKKMSQTPPKKSLHRPPATPVIGLAFRATSPPGVGAGELTRLGINISIEACCER